MLEGGNAASSLEQRSAILLQRQRAKINVRTVVNADETNCRRYYERFISINDDTFPAS